MTFETFLEHAAFDDVTFRRLVEGRRLYSRELARVQLPVFPCVCFQRTPGGSLALSYPDIPRHLFRVWAWSEDGYSSALELYDTFFDALHMVRKTYQTSFGVMRATDLPSTFYDETTDRYAMIAPWRADLFGL